MSTASARLGRQQPTPKAQLTSDFRCRGGCACGAGSSDQLAVFIRGQLTVSQLTSDFKSRCKM